MCMLQENLGNSEIGAALLGVSRDESLDPNTLATRTIEAFELLNEPVEAVDLLLATIAQMVRDDRATQLQYMAESLQTIWHRKNTLV